MVTDKIIDFLRGRNWQITRSDSVFTYLTPPSDFNLPKDYILSIPTDTNRVDFPQYYNSLLEIFSDFYDLGKQDLDTLLSEEDTILKVRIHDDKTANGKISFVRFEGFIERLKAIITDTASFVLHKDLMSTKIVPEAQKYINQCHFLQTEKGSYVTKIQLPAKALIKQEMLFTEPVYSEEINEKIIAVLGYVNKEIFKNPNLNVSDDYLMEHQNLLNVRLLRDIETLYDKSDIENIDFTLVTINETKEVKSEHVNKEEISRLTKFIDDVNNRSFETKLVTVKGKIDLLKSKDPDGGKNSITMQAIMENLPVIANANLASDMYKQAIDAHRIKEYITITGLATTTKTRVRFLEIQEFKIG